MGNKEIIEKNYKFAGFGQRLGALLIDSLIIFIFVAICIRILANSNLHFSEMDGSSIIGIILMYFLGLPLLGIIYQSAFECSKFQGTPGKIAIGIKVVTKQGSRVSFFQAFIRNLGKIISSSILYIGFLIALFNDEKQTLHDMMSSTYVISA